jgi:hypothetical protein
MFHLVITISPSRKEREYPKIGGAFPFGRPLPLFSGLFQPFRDPLTINESTLKVLSEPNARGMPSYLLSAQASVDAI